MVSTFETEDSKIPKKYLKIIGFKYKTPFYFKKHPIVNLQF